MIIDTALPFNVTSILNGLGALASLLSADITMQKLRNDRRNLIKVLIAVGFVYIYFMVPIWYGIYKLWGNFDFIAVIAISTLPLWGYGIGGPKGFRLTTYSLLGILILYAVVRPFV
jgi:hypothetical protein